MSEQLPEEQQEAQTGLDPVVMLVLSLMLLLGCGFMVGISSTRVNDTVADVVGVVGVLLGAAMLYRAVKRLKWL